MSDYNLLDDDDLMHMDGDEMLEEASLRAHTNELGRKISDQDNTSASEYEDENEFAVDMEFRYFEE